MQAISDIFKHMIQNRYEEKRYHGRKEDSEGEADRHRNQELRLHTRLKYHGGKTKKSRQRCQENRAETPSEIGRAHV